MPLDPAIRVQVDCALQFPIIDPIPGVSGIPMLAEHHPLPNPAAIPVCRKAPSQFLLLRRKPALGLQSETGLHSPLNILVAKFQIMISQSDGQLSLRVFLLRKLCNDSNTC